MRGTVVDASAVAAVLFDEPDAAPVDASVRGRLLAPTLLRYELASVATTRLIRHPHQARSIQQRYELLDRRDLHSFEPEWHALHGLVSRCSLSAYDAAYLQLALARDAALITLDARLAAAWDDAVASGRV